MSTLFQRAAFYKIVFVLSLFLLLFVSAITYRQLNAQNETERQVRISDKIHLELEKLFSFLKDAETAQRGYVITRDSTYLQPYFDAQVHVRKSYSNLSRLIAENPEQRQNLQEISNLVRQRFASIEKILLMVNSPGTGKEELIGQLQSGRVVMFRTRQLMNSMIDLEYRRMKEVTGRHKQNVLLTPFVTLLVTFLSLVVFILAFVRINRDHKKLTELIRKESEGHIVAESERVYRQIMEGLPAALYICDKEGKIQMYNHAASVLWGREPVIGEERLCGSAQAFDLSGEELDGFNNPIAAILRGEKVGNEEMIIVRPNGEKRIAIPHPQLMLGVHGEITGALNMVFDVTDQKESQKALQESEIRLRIATEGTGMATWDLDLITRNIVYSPRLNELFGFPEGSRRTHQDLRAVIHEEDKLIVRQAFETAMKTGVYTYSARVIQPDGTIKFIRTDGKVLFDNEGTPVRMLGTMLDITGRMINEIKLEQSERLFRTIALNIPDSLVIVFDWDYRILALDGDLLLKLGYNNEDYTNKLIPDITPPEKFAADKNNYDRVLAGEKFSLELPGDGNNTYMVHYVPLKNEKDETYAGLIIALDITEFRKIEQRISKLGAIVESSDDAIVSLTLQGIITSWNTGAERIFGYTEEEICENPISTIIPPDRANEEVNILAQIVKGERVDHFETKRLRKDGTLLDISLTLSPIKDSFGNIVGASKIARDITEQKKAERLLIESEELFRTLVDIAPVMVWMSGTDKLFTFFNSSWLSFTGRKVEDELGNGWTEGVHPEDVGRCMEMYDAAFALQEEFYIEYRLRRHDGVYRWISDKAVPRFSADGVFLGYIGGCMDIQETKDFTGELEKMVDERTIALQQVNEDLNHQKEFAETILDTSIDVNIVYDKDMRFLYFNKAAEQKYNTTKSGVLGKTLHEVYPGSIGSSGYNDLVAAIAGESIHNQRYKSSVADLFYEDFLIPIKNAEGQVYAVLVVARDITETIRNEELLRELNSTLVSQNTDLERSNAELASFNHVASHDLQEPLRKIQTFISRIFETANEEIDSKNVEYLKRIQVSANRMQLLIDDLLTFSRTNKADQVHISVDLNNTIDLVLRELSQTIEDKGAEVRILNKLPVIKGIAFQFHQLFVNLIGNALKYTQEEVKPVVEISWKIVTEPTDSGEKEFYRISVKDNGIGFDPKYADQIFELFQRLHGRNEYSGTGIGLTICKKIVENHHGSLTGVSEPGKGAEFLIQLPVPKTGESR